MSANIKFTVTGQSEVGAVTQTVFAVDEAEAKERFLARVKLLAPTKAASLKDITVTR